jgi:hypothetical protein
MNETLLKRVVVCLADENRRQYLMISAVLNELAALRETVRVLDPAFAEILDVKRKDAGSSGDEVVSLQVSLLDQIIQMANSI